MPHHIQSGRIRLSGTTPSSREKNRKILKFLKMRVCLWAALFSAFISTLLAEGGEYGEVEVNNEHQQALSDNWQKLQDELDTLIGDIGEKLKNDNFDDFWHPFEAGRGDAIREALHVSDVSSKELSGEFLQWKQARLGWKQYLVGLKRQEIEVYDTDLQLITTLSGNSVQEFQALTVFTRWNEPKNSPELIVLAVSAEPQLNLYLFQENELVAIAEPYPLHYRVQRIEFCHVGLSSKVVLVPAEPSTDVDIYNVELNNATQLWFFQRIPVKGSTTTTMVVFDSERMESVIAVGEEDQLSIYTWNTKIGMFEVSQELQLPHPCRSLFAFSVSYQNFVGCVPVEPSSPVRFVSFSYSANEYILEKEDAAFNGSRRILGVYPIGVPEYTDQYLTLTQDEGEEDGTTTTRLLVYHGKELGYEIEYNCSTTEQCPEAVDLWRGVGFLFKDFSAFMFPSSERSLLWLISTNITNTRSPLVDEQRLLFETYNELSSRFKRWEDSVSGIQKVLNESIQLDEKNVVEGEWSLNTLDARKGLIFEGGEGAGRPFDTLRFAGHEWDEKDFDTTLEQLELELRGVNSDIHKAEAELHNAIKEESDEIQHVLAPQTVIGSFTARRLRAKQSSLGGIGGASDAAKFFDSFLLKSSGDVIRVGGNIKFTASPVISHVSTYSIGSINVSSIARYSQENVFECPVAFGGTLTAHRNILTPTINGINISEEIMYLSDISDLTFLDGLVVFNNTVSKGNYSFDNVLLKSSNQLVTSPISFEQAEFKTPINVLNVNGYNVSQFLSSVVTTDYSKPISGAKRVMPGWSVKTELISISSTWNNVSFPSGFIRNKQKRVVLEAAPDFEQLTAKIVMVKGTLNGTALDDLVHRNGTMELNTNWVLEGNVEIIKDIAVAGLVDGVDMKELANKATLKDNRDIHIYGDVEFEQRVFISSLFINDTINDRGWGEVAENLIQFNGTEHCNVPGVTTIPGALFDSLTLKLGLVNGKNLSKIFLINGNQNITGDVEFLDHISFKSLSVSKSFADVDLEDLLSNAIRLSEENEVKWPSIFEHVRCEEGGLFVNGSINGIENFGESVALISGRSHQVIRGAPVVFKKGVVFENANVTEDLALREGQRIGDFDFKEWSTRRLTLDGSETILLPFFIEGPVKVNQDLNTPSINNVPLRRLQEEAFRLDIPHQSFQEHVKFHKLEVANGTIHFAGNILGDHNLDIIVEQGFPLNSTEELVLTGEWKFEKVVAEGNLHVGGLVCGLNLQELDEDTVRKGEGTVSISGAKIFENLKVLKRLNASTLNERDTSSIFTLSTNQTIGCPFLVAQNMSVHGDLKTDGKINDMSTELLSTIYSRKNNHTHFTHIIHSNAFSIEGNVTGDNLLVKGEIQGHNFTESLKSNHDFIKVDDPEIVFTGKKTFEGEVFIGANSRAVIYNGLGLDRRQFPLLTQDHVIPLFVKFNGHVRAKRVRGHDINVEILNALNWNQLVEDSLPISNSPRKEHEGNLLEEEQEELKDLCFDRIVVNGALRVTERMQGHPFEDYIRLSTGEAAQTLGDLKIDKVKVNGVEARVGTLNGVDVQQEFLDSVKREDENVEFSGDVSFMGSLTVDGDIVCLGPEFVNRVVSITEPFELPFSLEFSQAPHVKKELNVSEPFQGLTVEQIMRDGLTTNGDHNITGMWDFADGLTFEDDVSGPGTLENYEFESLQERTALALRAASDKIGNHKNKFAQECRKVNNVTGDLLFNPMKLDSFDKHQTIPLRESVDKILTVESSTKLLLLASTGCWLQSYVWNNESEQFSTTPGVDDTKRVFGEIKDWQSVTIDKIGVLLFSTTEKDCVELPEGLHYVTVGVDGVLSSNPVTLHTGPISAFKLVKEGRGRRTGAFALTPGPFPTSTTTLHSFQWNSYLSSFQGTVVELEDPYTQVDATFHGQGVALLLTSPRKLSVLLFDWKHKMLERLGTFPFLVSNTVPSTIFESYRTLYILVPSIRLNLEKPGTFSSPQLFVLVGRDNLMQLDKLPPTDVISKAVVPFSSQVLIPLLSRTFGLNIYKFQSLGGLVRLNSYPIKIFDGLGMVPFEIRAWEFAAARPFLAILTRSTIEVYHSVVYGDSLDYNSQNICDVV